MGLFHHAGGNHSTDQKKKIKKNTQAIATAKDFIWYEAMLPDGTAYLGDNQWSATLKISDVNYQLAGEERQKDILDSWMRVLNSFDEQTRVQLTISNRIVDSKQAAQDIIMSRPAVDDGLNQWRDSFDSMTQTKLIHQSSNVLTDKYLTLSVQAEDKDRADSALNKLYGALTEQLAAIEGCHADWVSRAERLQLINTMLNPGQPFLFSEKAERRSLNAKQTTKDYVVPWAIDFTGKDHILLSTMEDTYQTHVWLSDFPAQLTDTLISDLAAIRASIVINVHMKPWDRGKGLEEVKKKQAGVKQEYDRSVLALAKQGLGAESVPDSITDKVDQMTSLLEELQSSNQRIIDTYIQVSINATSEQELKETTAEVERTARRLSCKMQITKHMMPEALNAMLPLAVNRMPVDRALTTDCASILIPFTSQELNEKGGVFYGVNARSNVPLVINRSKHMNSNGFILGTSGSGKSQSAKNEIAQQILKGTDRVIIIDPEHEYVNLTKALGGTVIRIGADSDQHMNPMDIHFDSDDSDPVKAKTSNVIALLGSLIGGTTGLDQLTKSMIDKCCMRVYTAVRQEYRDTGHYTQPTFADLQQALRLEYLSDQQEKNQKAIDLDIVMDQFVTGSSSGLAQRTDVDLTKKIIDFDVSGLEGEIRTFGMMTVLSQVWDTVRAGRASGIRTWLYADEFHVWFNNDYAVATFKDIFKRARKYGLGVTGITQNIDELLDNEEARLMLSNADFLLLLNQKRTDAISLQELLGLSDEQLRHISNVRPGCGLINTAGVSIPFDNRMDTSSKLYKLYTTKFGEEAHN